MEILKCYNCGSIENRFYAEENGFILVKCINCGLLYVKNRPDDDKILSDTKKGLIEGDKSLHVTLKYNADKINYYKVILNDLFSSSFGTIHTWLDIGCGHGEFMKTLEEVSSEKIIIKGNEPNVKKQESARNRGLDVEYFEIESHNSKYDMISMLDVYSHLPDPVLYLNKLKSLLNPRGEILIETGDTSDFTAKEQVGPFCLPDHLSFASERIVVNILERLNFEIVCIKKYPYFPLNFKSIAKEIIKIFLPNYTSYIKCYLKWEKYAQTNMFIRARLKSLSSSI
jgi:SAM-dependent methyltransferase